MDPLHLAIALIPLAMYLLVLAIVNLGRYPFVTTGMRDWLALALGLSGLVIAGPMELFMPENAAQLFGGYVWLLLMALYGLTCLLMILTARPRLVIYNISPSELEPVLQKVVRSLDASATCTDGTYLLPQVYMQFHVEPFVPLRNVSLVPVGGRQSWQSWRKLDQELIAALVELPARRNPYGVTLLLAGIFLAVVSTVLLANNHQAVAQALADMLRL